MIALIIGLIVGYALAVASIMHGGMVDDIAPATEIGPEIGSEIIPDSVPTLTRVYDDGGELQHEWTARQYGLIGWTRQPELLIFLAFTAGGLNIVAGDPSDGALYEIDPLPPGGYDYAEQPDTLIIRSQDGDRRIALPGEVVQPRQTEGYPNAAGLFRVAADGVRRDGQLLLEDRGLEHSLLASPSGRWVAAVERQRSNTYVIWSIDARGGNPEFVRMVDYAELPLDFAQGNPLSPNRRWFVTPGSNQTILRSESLIKILPVGSSSQPLWREDSAAFLLSAAGIGLIVVDMPEATLRVAISRGPWALIGWEGDRILWLAATIGSDE